MRDGRPPGARRTRLAAQRNSPALRSGGHALTTSLHDLQLTNSDAVDGLSTSDCQQREPTLGRSPYKFMLSASCAAASIFALPKTMASLALSPRIQQSSMSAHTCISTRLGPDKRAWL